MGFVIVQVGWQGDLTVTDRNIVPFLPIARYPSGSSIVGPAVEEFIFNDEEVVSEASLTYAVVALMPGLATFSVRARQGAPRVPIEEPYWSFTNERQIRGQPPLRIRRRGDLRTSLSGEGPDKPSVGATSNKPSTKADPKEWL